MAHTKKGRKVALLAGLALVVLSVAVVWTYWEELRSWYAFRRDFERLGKNVQDYPEYRHRETGIVFVGLPGGTFEMGSPETEIGRKENEGPVHKVSLSPFLIAKYGAATTIPRRFKSATSDSAPPGRRLEAGTSRGFQAVTGGLRMGFSVASAATFRLLSLPPMSCLYRWIAFSARACRLSSIPFDRVFARPQSASANAMMESPYFVPSFPPPPAAITTCCLPSIM